ncbi:MAG: hypothetical protein COB17_04320 [Sulfurimonas sp.]|nr:MAG: hypothetical protein COB17_04320 [Sulfurimonas sp.]
MSIFFSACSSKEVYKPNTVKDDWNNYGDIDGNIINVSSTAALLENRKVLIGSKILDVSVAESYKLLGFSDGWVISANMDGDIRLQFSADKSLKKNFKLKKTIASASIKDDVLAVLFINNDMELYSISTGKLLLKEQGNAPIVVNSKIVSPHFMDDLVLFFTLDGKVVIISLKEKKKLRTVIVSSEEYFNNIIYFNVVDGKIIAATGHKILAMSEKELRVKYDIRDVIYDDGNIYITTKQGEIVSLTSDLKYNKKIKFPFAHFLGMVATKDKIYVLEKEGYIIELSKDLLEYNVYDVDVSEGYVFVADKVFYVNDEYISAEVEK